MRVDLNSDVGESFGRLQLGDDEAVLDVVTSADVACGFHAGHTRTLRRARRVEVSAESVCVHRDSPGAVELATAMRTVLLAAGVELGAFA